MLVALLPACASSPPPNANPPSPPAAMSPAMTTAADRVKGLLASPDDAAIAQAFSAKFLESVPAAKIKALFADLGPKVGACGSADPVDVDAAATQGAVRFTCEKATVVAKIVAQPSPPYLMDGLLLNAKPK
jgi:outer membrane protein TolC